MLACITYTTILEYLVTHFREQRRLFDDSIYDLNIGTYENIVTVKAEQPLRDVLSVIESRGLSAVPGEVFLNVPFHLHCLFMHVPHTTHPHSPVVDDAGVVVNVYSASDITFLATATDADSAVSNLSLSLGSILSQQRSDVSTHDRLYTCSRNSTLQSVFEIFASVKFNRLICVNEEGRCNGIMSGKVAILERSDELEMLYWSKRSERRVSTSVRLIMTPQSSLYTNSHINTQPSQREI